MLVPVCAAAQEPTADRQRELIALVRHDCGACHGLTLAGGLGPALTPAALRGRAADGLVATILHGRAGTPMPPWKSMLTDADARWIVARLQSGFPALDRR